MRSGRAIDAEELAAELPTQKHLNADETATEEQHGKAWLGTFVRDEEVEPTNNTGERALRHAVIWRQLSFGTRSASGSRFVETMLTVIETCRQQHPNTFDYLTTAIAAHLAGQPAPTPLPRLCPVTIGRRSVAPSAANAIRRLTDGQDNGESRGIQRCRYFRRDKPGGEPAWLWARG